MAKITLCITICYYAECHIFSVVILYVIVHSVLMMNVIMLSVIKLIRSSLKKEKVRLCQNVFMRLTPGYNPIDKFTLIITVVDQ